MAILSERLTAVAEMITPGRIVADIGCDHAYLSIYLLKNEICERVIACDINKGPLEIAKSNIAIAGYADQIDVRLADGLKGIKKGEVSSIVIAGMGGRLMGKILDEGRDVLETVHEIILEPQSEVASLRHFLEDNGYFIVSEEMVFEEGKYYPIIKAEHGSMNLGDEIYYKYGKILLREENPILHQFLIQEKTYYGQLLMELSANKDKPKVASRIDEVRIELAQCEKALVMMNEPGIYQDNRIIVD